MTTTLTIFRSFMIASLPFCVVCGWLLLITSVTAGQATSSHVDIITIYSQNNRFYLKSIPFDNESPSLRGKTSVYEKGKVTPLYTLNRSFDALADTDRLILSNDGEVIFYVISFEANEEKDGLRSINVYKKGKLIRSFTEMEITGCDKKKERCSLVYSNYDAVVDLEKSQFGSKDYKKEFKDGVDEKERFLSDFAVFSFDDVVYLTDSKKRVHTFDLRDGRHIESDSFDNLYNRIKAKGRLTKSEQITYEAPILLRFPKLKNGRDSYASLANYIGMKAGDPVVPDNRYRWYSFKVNSNLLRDGSLEIESIEADSELPKEKILEFLRVNRFHTRWIPKVFEKWNLGNEYFYFRNRNDRIALREKEQDRIKERQEFEKRLTLESINGVYIPANLGECFPELDKRLSEVDKKEIKALPERDDMIRYHLTLGMWMRNNWVLWGGSRLQKYFTDKGITHPEEMSSIIMYHYHDWLNDKKDSWKEWEKKPHKGALR